MPDGVPVLRLHAGRSGEKSDGGEMAQQIYAAERDQAVTVSHVVVMGCGEPFDNYDQLLRFLDLVHHPLGKGMSLRLLRYRLVA